LIVGLESAERANVLRVEALKFSFPARPVLRGIDLAVQSGEIVALLGPNGAGKSTLIRCICNRLAPDSGSIWINERPLRRRLPAPAPLALVPQHVALYPHLTPEENIAVFARLAGLARVRVAAAVRRTAARCGLEPVAGQRCATLSGGWQRRVNIACALAHGPSLLILDEPTVGIDPPARAQIEDLLGMLAGDGLAILMTSHELDQLERLAHRVAFLNDGVIVEQGPPATVLERRFGGKLEARLRLAANTATNGVSLQHLGLAPRDPERIEWSGLLAPEQARALSARLPEALEVGELRLRRPGLDALWRVIYGERQEPAR